ncbi:CPXCG motif-containing cysteine-rich protein [Marinicellulosiphila megalodicopiae]|uniref:CPXCG motif-containing cysteine-rich protein n=1 Tax=Marinicellulosiphila megalodicopiae TaxID=2724896 RepID=UPI003BAFAFBB
MNGLIEKNVSCPYCGETINVIIEVLDENQEYIEDCQVCCRPIIFQIQIEFDESVNVYVRSENESF